MSKIRVDTEILKQQHQEMEQIAKELGNISEEVSYVRKNLSWQIASRDQIKSKLSDYSNYIGNMQERTKGISIVLQNTAEQYETTEKKLGAVSVEQSETQESDSNEKKDTTEEDDILSIIKQMLTGYDKFEGNKEAGVLKNIIEYIESLKAFLTGDKKGLTGARDWLDLAKSSVGAWKGLYEYFQNKYDGMKTGFFGDVAQKNVKILGFTAGFLGLFSSIISASQGLSEKKWQSIVADYLNCGKDVVSIINSGYGLKHIGDAKSLTAVKVGVWNALSLYAAIGKAGFEAVSQGFRSFEKYYADGSWDMGDTGATGIDISLAGIYGICHSLTFGLDDLIFRAVDAGSGGDGTKDMSYFEKAAEGYKIMAEDIANTITEWIKKLKR